MLGLLALWIGAASAQDPGDFTIRPEVLLQANGGGSGYMVNGTGAPSVVFDTTRNRWIMVYEVRLAATDPQCPVGRWAIGLASSTNGLTWTPLANALVNPGATGTYYSCVAAHPTAVYAADTDSLWILFKSEQRLDACASSTPAWGCARYTGVGRARVRFNPGGSVRSTTVLTTPAMEVGVDMGFPKFTQRAGINYLGVTLRPDAYLASSATLRDFSLSAEPVLSPGLVPWGQDEIFNFSLVCEDDPAFPLSGYPGGRNLDLFAITDAGMGKAITSDFASWFLGADTYFTWADDNAFRHWEVLRTTTGEYYMYFSEKDSSGNPRIRAATTGITWPSGNPYSKICP